ncbi:MAG: hypothetical protein KDD63_15910, partial [Bacteroidetes bacterium]|nr:hypothetical protein [Bacteroidota bacterium]
RPSIPEPTDPRVYNPATNIHQGEVELRVDPNFDPSPQYVESPVKDVKKNLIPRPAPSKEQDVAVNEFVKDRAKKMDREVRVFYFGKSLKMKYDSKMEISSPRTLSSNSIAEHWEGLEEAPHEFLIYQLTNEAKIMNLNDWGFALLINETGKQIYPGDKNAQIMFNWFCLSKAGYMSTVSYERDQLYLMLPAYQVLYGKSFLRGKDHKLYAIDLDGGNPQLSRARVFQAAHPEAKKVMDFSVNSTPDFPESLRRKRVSFSYNNVNYVIPIDINENTVAFYKTYPFVDLDIYLGAPLAQSAKRSMVDSLRRIVERIPAKGGRSREMERVNLILRFVQTAFPYKSDNDQFGEEKYLFGDETLYYPYSDCEDRSVLFTYLVKEIMGLDVVGLLFPGHAATAVHFNGNVPGDYVKYQGKKYIICDPTYINADLGMMLPDVQGQSVKVVSL